MNILKTPWFAIRDLRDDDETRVSGTVRAEWCDHGQDCVAAYAYENVTEYRAAVLNAMAMLSANRQFID